VLVIPMLYSASFGSPQEADPIRVVRSVWSAHGPHVSTVIHLRNLDHGDGITTHLLSLYKQWIRHWVLLIPERAIVCFIG
jgi:hypothetical protein